MEGLVMNVVHYPSLKTILAIEDALKKADTPLSRNQILARLPTKVMRSTLNLALAYMAKRKLVVETDKGFIWTLSQNDEPERSTVNNIARIKRAILPILKSQAVSRAAIFGSTARGEARKNSDVDLLVEFKKRVTLFDMGGLKMDLEEKLKRKVDIVEYSAVDRRLRESIFRDKVDIL